MQSISVISINTMRSPGGGEISDTITLSDSDELSTSDEREGIMSSGVIHLGIMNEVSALLSSGISKISILIEISEQDSRMLSRSSPKNMVSPSHHRLQH